MEKSLIHTKFTDTLSPDYTTGSQSIKVSCLMFEKYIYQMVYHY